jgi:hypothetical protein
MYLFANELKYLVNSDKLSHISKAAINKFINPPKIPNESFLAFALESIVNMLYEFYDKEVAILIDEYDSMLTHAIGKGHEQRLGEFLSGFFGRVFKGNDQVDFVVLTGCLWIAKESSFGGTNNLYVTSVSDYRYSSCFGLTDNDLSSVLVILGCRALWTLSGNGTMDILSETAASLTYHQS